MSEEFLENQVTEGVDEGLSVKEISTKYDLSLQEVRDVIERQGLADRLQNRGHWKWSEEENAKLIEEWTVEPRPSLAEVAEAHKRSLGAIAARIKILVKDGRLPEDAKAKFRPRKWTAVEVNTLKRMVDEGCGWPEIAVACLLYTSPSPRD